MKATIQLITVCLLVFFSACKEQPKEMKDDTSMEKEVASNAMVPELWITKRVEKAKARLESSKAGKVVWNAMEAHGGLKKWFLNGALSFRFDYKPLDGKTQRDSYQTIDTWSNKARHTSATDSTAHYGWTGDTAWVQAKDSTAFAYDTKFWALTPFYFLGQPFILDGDGVNLELLPQENYKERANDVVKVTFAAGTGDAPDDYYVLYFDAETHLLKVIRYIVSYPKYFKDGGHAPEKFMDVLGEKEVNGIILPTAYKTHWLAKDNLPGEYITQITVSDIHFDGKLDSDYFEKPEGAKVIE